MIGEEIHEHEKEMYGLGGKPASGPSRRNRMLARCPRQAVKRTRDQGAWVAAPLHVLMELARPPEAAPRSCRHPAAPKPCAPQHERPRAPRPRFPQPNPTPPRPQARRPQASGGWRRRRGPPTWPPIAASAPPASAQFLPGAQPHLGGRHGGAAAAARLAWSSLAPRPLCG